MVKYVLKRIALMFFVFFTILTVCFVLKKLLPLVDAKQFGKDMTSDSAAKRSVRAITSRF